MAYFTLTDLQGLLGQATVFELFNDGNLGQVNQVAFNLIANLASSRLDGKLARVYPGPFPVTQVPVPENILMGALLYGKALAYQRRAEYVKRFGDAPIKEAEAFAQQLCEATELLSDFLGQPVPANVGVIVYDSGPRTIVDSADGTSNGGDL